jgi:membrane-associated protease RseP (regulator of RpoE activity)
MRPLAPLGLTLALLGAVAVSAHQSPPTAGADVAFASFFQARTPREAAAASDQIVASGVGFEEAFRRLRRGRVYSRDVPRGVVQASYRSETGDYFYTLDVPESYIPDRKYQVRVQLHGGVGRIEDNTPPRSGSSGRLSGAEQIFVMPYAWRDAPWWSGRQVDNLRAILDRVKHDYNVDENRVVLSGVSDGGTGAYYTAMRETTPFASFLPLIGFIMVLANETPDADGDLFPNNLRNKPMFIVNGGRDPRYPTSIVDPYVAHLKQGGVDLVYRPLPDAAHDTSWWPDIKDSFETFVADHPRRPLPDALSWESGPPGIPSRAHWLVIDRLAAARPDLPPLQDLNRMSTPPVPDFGMRGSGTRVNRVVRGSNAEQVGLRSGDVVVRINNQPTPPGADVADLLLGYAPGRPLLITVTRGKDNDSIRLTGKYAPTVLPGQADTMFPPQRESGRVDLVRAGNRVDATSRGVGTFTLLLSPDQFDLDRAVTVVVNGRTVFEGLVGKDLRTLLSWAARDNDRTLLFAAELHVDAPR